MTTATRIRHGYIPKHSVVTLIPTPDAGPHQILDFLPADVMTLYRVGKDAFRCHEKLVRMQQIGRVPVNGREDVVSTKSALQFHIGSR